MFAVGEKVTNEGSEVCPIWDVVNVIGLPSGSRYEGSVKLFVWKIGTTIELVGD